MVAARTKNEDSSKRRKSTTPQRVQVEQFKNEEEEEEEERAKQSHTTKKSRNVAEGKEGLAKGWLKSIMWRSPILTINKSCPAALPITQYYISHIRLFNGEGQEEGKKLIQGTNVDIKKRVICKGKDVIKENHKER
jgi:hypothetical protein